RAHRGAARRLARARRRAGRVRRRAAAARGRRCGLAVLRRRPSRARTGTKPPLGRRDRAAGAGARPRRAGRGRGPAFHRRRVAHVLERARRAVVAVADDFLGLDLSGRLRDALPEAGVPAPQVAVVAGPGRPPVPAAEAARHDVGAGTWVPPEPAGPPPAADAL